VSAQNTFCERYGGTEAAGQYGLISAVVTRAVVGATAAATGSNAVTGLINEPLNKPYFNGTKSPFIDYTTNAAAFNTLADHLFRFFTFALGCRSAAGNATYAWTPQQMYRLHSAMGITPAIMTAFIGEVASSLTSFGVVLGSGVESEAGFIIPLMGLFNRYPTNPTDTTTIFGNGFQICTAATCPLATQIVQFHVGDDNVITQLNAATTTATIGQGDYVNFRYGATGGVTQTATATGTTAQAGGLASTLGTRTYTVQMNTPGTYYFYSNLAASGAKATITVTASSSSGSSMMASSTGRSTGTNAASSSATLGFASVLAVAAAVAAVVA